MWVIKVFSGDRRRPYGPGQSGHRAVPDPTAATRRRSCLTAGGHRSPRVSGMCGVLKPHTVRLLHPAVPAALVPRPVLGRRASRSHQRLTSIR